MPHILPDRQSISSCCKAPLETIHGNDGTSYYSCSKCHEGADPIHISRMSFIQEWKESNKIPVRPPKRLLQRLKEWVGYVISFWGGKGV